MDLIKGNNPLVSIIMNCYNGEKFLKEAVESVLAQTYPNWELIFWDNQSTDKSAEIFKTYTDSRMHYFYALSHTSLGEARNLAIGKSNGDFICFLDCDDIWLPLKLERQVNILGKAPGIDFIYTNYYRFNTLHNKKVLALQNKKQPEGNVFKSFLLKYPVALVTVMIRKSVLKNLGIIFDDNLNLSEEFDVFMRVLYNSKAQYIHEPLATYRIHSENASIKYFSKWPEENLYVINKLRHFNKDIPKKYANELQLLENEAHLLQAGGLINQGNFAMARNNIKIFKVYHFNNYRYNLKCIVMYLSTYFPRLWRKVNLWFSFK